MRVASDPPLQLTRRTILRSALSTLAAIALRSSPAAALEECNPSVVRYEPSPKAAVSLKRLDASLLACQRSPGGGQASPPGGGSRCDPKLGKLTRLDGFVYDMPNNDIVLWGQAEPHASPLLVDDFVVALRAAVGQYRQVVDGALVRMAPAISIDPQGVVWKELDKLPFTGSRWRHQYELQCAAPQRVRVDGMPRYVAPSFALVEADYRMKQVNFGLHKLPLAERFPAIVDIQHKLAVDRNRAGKEYASLFHAMRYWFTPGTFDYQVGADENECFLESSQILLKNKVQKIVGKAVVDDAIDDPVTAAYTCAWNSRMESLVAAEESWKRLYDIFRHFAIANILVQLDALQAVQLQADALLKVYQPRFVALPDTVPGLSRVVGNKRSTMTTRICGGVSLALDGTMSKKPQAVSSRRASAAVMASRPRVDTLSWAVAG